LTFLKKHRKGYRRNRYNELKKAHKQSKRDPEKEYSSESEEMNVNCYAEAKSLIECKFLTKNLWNDFWTEGNESTLINLLNNDAEQQDNEIIDIDILPQKINPEKEKPDKKPEPAKDDKKAEKSKKDDKKMEEEKTLVPKLPQLLLTKMK
jgi:hypothetical protein